MSPAGNETAAEEQHAEEGGLEKEGAQHLVGEERREDVRGGIGIAAPVGAELEGHDHPGDDAHAERDREDPRPEARQPEVHFPPPEEVQGLEYRDVAGEAYRE